MKEYINKESIVFKELASVQSTIDASGVEPLVDWLHKTYGLQVYGFRANKVCMAYGNGIHVCSVYTDKNVHGDVIYCYESKVNPKQKAKRSDSIYIRESVKLASLKKAIAKVVPTLSLFNTWVSTAFHDINEVISNSVNSNAYKNKYDLDDPIIHAMMQYCLGGNTNSPIDYPLDKAKIAPLLEKWDNADATEIEKRLRITDIFASPLYALGIKAFENNKSGVTGTNQYFLGVVKLTNDSPLAAIRSFETVVPYTRIADISECPSELQSIITMFKVRHEHKEMAVDFIPKGSSYDNDLSVVTLPSSKYYSEHARGGLSWFLTPKN